VTNTNGSRLIMASERRRGRGRSRAFAMLEILLAVLIMSFGIIPIYYIFTSSKTTVFKSEMSYVALLAARERLDELRLMPVEALMALAQAGESQWMPVKGHAFAALVNATQHRQDRAATAGGTGSSGGTSSSGTSYTLPEPNFNIQPFTAPPGGSSSTAGGAARGFEYPAYYERILLKTRITHIVPMSAAQPGGQTAPAGPVLMFRATVTVRWQETGERVEQQEQERPKSFVSKLETIFSVGDFGEGRER